MKRLVVVLTAALWTQAAAAQGAFMTGNSLYKLCTQESGRALFIQ